MSTEKEESEKKKGSQVIKDEQENVEQPEKKKAKSVIVNKEDKINIDYNRRQQKKDDTVFSNTIKD